MAHIYNLSQWFRVNSTSVCYYIGHETTLTKLSAVTLNENKIKKTANYNAVYFNFPFPSPHADVPESVWIALTSFASQGLLNRVQNWRHLPVPVFFYYMAYSP